MTTKLWLGMPGSGKTLAMMDTVRAEAARGHSFFVVDRAGEWGPGEIRWRGRTPARILTAPHPTTAPDDIRDWLADAVETDGPGAVVLFRYPWEGRDVAQWVQSIGDVTYTDDEIDLVATYSAWEDNPLRNFIHRGRHLPDADGVVRKVHVFGAARRPQNLHIDVTSLADEVMTFRIQGARTLKRLVDDTLLDGAEHVDGEDPINLWPNLRYVLWRSDGSRVEGVLKGL